METYSHEVEKTLRDIGTRFNNLENDCMTKSRKLYAAEIELSIYRQIFDGNNPCIYIMPAPHNIYTLAKQYQKFSITSKSGWINKLSELKANDILLMHHTGMGIGEYIVVDHISTHGQDKDKEIIIHIKYMVCQNGYISAQNAKKLLGKQTRFSGAPTLLSLEDGLKIISKIYENIR